MKKALRIIMLSTMLVVILLSMAACGKTEIDITEGMTVKFSGVDGSGQAEIVFPGSDGTPPYVDKILESGKIEAEDWEAWITLGQAISIELDPSTRLSNGDQVTVTVDVDEAILKNMGFTANDKKISFTVEGLTEIITIHPFENFEISFSGISPDVIAEHTRSQEIDGVGVSYKIEESGPYKDGDVLTIRASISNSKYYKLAEETIQVTVAGVDKYITCADEILPETMNAMREKADQMMAERFRTGAPTDYYQFGDFEYAGYVFMSRDEGTIMGDKNVCFILYTVDVVEDGQAYTSTYYYSFANILQRLNGSQEVAVDKVSRPFKHSDYELKNYKTIEDRFSEIESVWGQGYIIEKTLSK